MDDRILEHYLEEFRLGSDIPADEAETLFDALIGHDDEKLLTEVLTSWNEKGTTEDELFAFASLMRSRMKRIETHHETFVDIVGTGGSNSKSFNVSTAAAFVIAGSGVPVAKHGNRAATSNSGSSDALQELGVDVDIEIDKTEQHLNEHGLCFMFAPRFHSLSPTLATARRLVGRPTIFNNLGPLCNPASAPHLVLGVWDKHLIESTANVLLRLGAARSWVVYGENGLDEISLKGATIVAEVVDGEVDIFEINAADFEVFTLGKDLPEKCSAADSAKIIRAILANEMQDRDAERLVLLNAAAALLVSEKADTLPEAYDIAKASIRNGSALNKLNVLSTHKK
ncbi:MAG TPA: anthranilate phosphoribosyltransferase [Pyrinomonadaceae bacterium]|nr:anthranilate phosphoribosyltransferase [Pyrinomonadaceae bacterium]